MSSKLSPKHSARSDKKSSEHGLSVLAALIAPLIAVLLSNYLNTQGKYPTAVVLPVHDIDANRREGRHPEPRLEAATAKDSPGDHVQLWQAFPLKTEKQALAKKLIGKASETKDDPASQLVLLRLAKDIATQASDGQTAFQAIDTMAETFPVDTNTMKMAVLAKFASAAQKPAQHKSIAEQALKLADQSVSQGRFPVASQLSKLALAEATRAVDRELLAQAQGEIAKITELVKARERTSGH